MKKQLMVLFPLALLIGIVISGCSSDGQTGNEDVKWVCPMTVMVDGNLYQHERALDGDIEVDKSQILGNISSVVSITQLPKQDGEANYDIMDAPYARWNDENYGDTIVVFYNDVWHIFSLYEEE